MLGRVAKSSLSAVSTVRQSVRRTGLYPAYHKQLVGAPVTRISQTEKFFWLGFFIVGTLGYPAWVLVHLEEYKGKK